MTVPLKSRRWKSSTSPRGFLTTTRMRTSAIVSAVLFRYAAQDNRLIDPSTPREWVIHSQLRSLSIPAVFLTSIPISFIAVGLAQLWWLWMIPLRLYFTRRYGKITDVWSG